MIFNARYEGDLSFINDPVLLAHSASNRELLAPRLRPGHDRGTHLHNGKNQPRVQVSLCLHPSLLLHVPRLAGCGPIHRVVFARAIRRPKNRRSAVPDKFQVLYYLQWVVPVSRRVNVDLRPQVPGKLNENGN